MSHTTYRENAAKCPIKGTVADINEIFMPTSSKRSGQTNIDGSHKSESEAYNPVRKQVRLIREDDIRERQREAADFVYSRIFVIHIQTRN